MKVLKNVILVLRLNPLLNLILKLKRGMGYKINVNYAPKNITLHTTHMLKNTIEYNVENV